MLKSVEEEGWAKSKPGEVETRPLGFMSHSHQSSTLINAQILMRRELSNAETRSLGIKSSPPTDRHG